MVKWKISAFDLDHTLLHANCSFKFGVFLYKKKAISFFKMFYLAHLYFLHKIGLSSLYSMQQRIFNSLFLNASSDVFLKLTQEFVEKQLSYMRNEPVLNILETAKQQGHYTMILSSSPHFLVQSIAEKLQVDAWEATHYNSNSHNCFSHISYFLFSDDKAAALTLTAQQLHVEKNNIFAYSDSYLDLTFLQSAGNPVAVNPDRKLRKHCKQHQWRVL